MQTPFNHDSSLVSLDLSVNMIEAFRIIRASTKCSSITLGRFRIVDPLELDKNVSNLSVLGEFLGRSSVAVRPSGWRRSRYFS